MSVAGFTIQKKATLTEELLREPHGRMSLRISSVLSAVSAKTSSPRNRII